MMASETNEMRHFLVLKLSGVLQAWGGHTYEDFRHTELIPTRSALLGLLAACLGVDRKDTNGLQVLSATVRMAVRADQTKHRPQRITDFHTVMEARKVDGKPNKFPVVSHREYLCDAQYTVLLEVSDNAKWSLKQIRQALESPVYTPFLGRRSCPISRPLFETEIEAVDFESAFALIDPGAGAIYSEESPSVESTLYRLRDVPLYGRKRQFASRELHLYQQEGDHVPE
ncbi:type I-E CRISPR-associated protein Cas5/CasD [Thiolapillus sp.]